MELGPLLDARGPAEVERPPMLWEVDADQGAVDRMLAQMAAIARPELSARPDLVWRANNVTVEQTCGNDTSAPAEGDYVAITLLGTRGWCVDGTWRPVDAKPLVSLELDRAARAAGAAYAYTRDDGDYSSITVFLPRLGI
jgi:hypothetical protein